MEVKAPTAEDTFRRLKYIPIYLKDVNINTLEIDNVCMSDYPDFSAAYICYGRFLDGRELSDAELSQLTNDHPDIVADMALEYAEYQ